MQKESRKKGAAHFLCTEEGSRKTKAQLELKLVRDVKGKRKDLHSYTGSKSKAE